MPAGPREAGARCPHCVVEIALAQPVVSCLVCGTVHHQSCWEGCRGCGSYSCSPSRREVGEPAADRMVITFGELEDVVPLPTRKPLETASKRRFEEKSPPKWSRLAIASFVTGLAGIPLFGLFTGLVAMVLACLSLGPLQSQKRKGLAFALGGLFLGLADFVGWVIFVYVMLSNPTTVNLPTEGEPALSSEDISPKIYRAMKANVLIERHAGWSGMAVGSGVILQVEDGKALIITNRHVADPNFPSKTAPPDLNSLNTGKLNVRLLNGPSRPGRVLWVAPDGVDLALVRIEIKPGEAEVAQWMPGRPMKVGEQVFAIGNPQQLNWTHTQGVISQFRSMNFEGRSIRVIQTQTAINPGNSGGGLYDDDAYLIGINTWTSDKRSSEGLSFAITFDSLLAMNPPGLTMPPPRSDEAKKEEKTP